MERFDLPALSRRVLPWAAVLLFCGWFFAPLLLDLGTHDWEAPEGSDALVYGAWIKMMIETGWVWQTPRMAAPFGMNFFDFPGSDAALLLVIKFLTLFSSDASVVMNLFFVAGFVMIFASTYWVFRRCGVDVAWSTAAGLIHACLPYHFLRGVNHLYLSNYFVVPLLTWVALRIYPGETPGARTTGRWWSWREVAVLVVGSSGGVYYAFFGMALILVAGLLGWVQERDARYPRRALLALAIVAAGVLANLAPSIHYWVEQGRNEQVAQRHPQESEIYGLRAAQLVLPGPGHRLEPLARETRAAYHDHVTPLNEAKASTLGIVGALGFVLLTWLALFAGPATDPRIAVLAKMNLALFLFAVIGGFAVLFALFVTPQFRGTNRVSVYIGFIALLGLFLWVKERPFWRQHRLAGSAWIKYPLALALTCVALYDEIPAGARPADPPAKQDATRSRQDAYASFIASVEASIPRGGMIYTLPYTGFPETRPAFEEGYNGLLRTYYYSSHARWSFGAMRGRAQDDWLKLLETMPLRERIEALQKTGFEGIFVERRAYQDHAAALERELRELLGAQALESADKGQAFYRLKPAAVHALTPSYALVGGHAAHIVDNAGGKGWGSSERKFSLRLYNFTQADLPMSLNADLWSMSPSMVRLSMRGEVLAQADAVPTKPQPLALKLILHPGVNLLDLQWDTALLSSRPDVRATGVVVMNPVLALQ